MGEAFKISFFKIAAVIVLYLGLVSINSALIALDSPIQFHWVGNDSQVASTSNTPDTNQSPVIDISSSGYSPTYLKVKQGLPVSLTLKTKDAYSCASAFRIPELGIVKNLQPNDTQMITFTPTQPGTLQFNFYFS